ncbi:MAG: thiamine phosphate synthase [Oscillospiraceae bacterium]|jgi:thiamine-phosphate pyrophosphorylase|nr:thiamine phosphate synthase [Oscillospiraceae bacterium]
MKKIAITARELYGNDFFAAFKTIAGTRPYRIILREKDLPYREYLELARECKQICENFGIPLVINTFIQAGMELSIKHLQLPYEVFLKFKNSGFPDFKEIGVSVHSTEEAVKVSNMNRPPDYLIAGHIFTTDCKKDIPPKGLQYLTDICSSVEIPVFAVGGITDANASAVINAGAYGFAYRAKFELLKK